MWLTIQETSLAMFVGLRQGELGNALSLLFSGHLTIAVNVYKKITPNLDVERLKNLFILKHAKYHRFVY